MYDFDIFGALIWLILIGAFFKGLAFIGEVVMPRILDVFWPHKDKNGNWNDNWRTRAWERERAKREAARQKLLARLDEQIRYNSERLNRR